MNPPNHVLDLGCGTGHWAVEAASYWQSEGTRVTGFDLVDLTSDIWGRGAAVPNVRFVRGNLCVLILRPSPIYRAASFPMLSVLRILTCTAPFTDVFGVQREIPATFP